MKKDDKEKVDIPKLNEVIKISRNMLKVVWAAMIVGLILITTYLFKEWKIFEFINTLLAIISPFFIGIVVAWILDPLVNWLQKNGVNRTFATILVFLFFISILIIFFALMIPALGDQINEFISSAPNIINYLKDFGNNFFSKLSDVYNYDFTNIQTNIYDSIVNLVTSITVDLPNKIVNIASSIISSGINIILGLFVGFYMLFDFNNVRKHLLNLLPKRFH